MLEYFFFNLKLCYTFFEFNILKFYLIIFMFKSNLTLVLCLFQSEVKRSVISIDPTLGLISLCKIILFVKYFSQKKVATNGKKSIG